MYAIVAGGGKVGFFLARELIEQGHEVLIIENNSERADFIATS
jgi:trk system potassium uptake protein TrkA